MSDKEKSLQKVKSKYYSHSNNAGKLLASVLKTRQLKSQLPSITDPITDTLVYHPKDIANTFQKYYASLYNLKDDPHHNPSNSRGYL